MTKIKHRLLVGYAALVLACGDDDEVSDEARLESSGTAALSLF